MSFVKISCIALTLTVACGGATSSAGSHGDNSASGDNGGGDNGASGDNGAGGGDNSASGNNGGSGTVAPSGTNAGGTPGDTGMTGTNAGGTSGMAAAPGPGQITCGKATCEGATPVCCIDARGSSCAASTADCADDAGRTVVVLTCTGKATCANDDVCCTARADGGVRGAEALVTECAAECAGGEAQVCEVDSDCGAADICALFNASAYGACVPDRDAGRTRFDAGRPAFDGGRPADAGRPAFDGGRRPRDASID
jgi:hypothetical protein